MSGRPTKLTTKLLDKLDDIADDGLELKQVCSQLNIDARTWRRWEAEQAEESPFRRMAARVRAGMGSATDDLAWGVLREVAQDPDARPSDRLAAATAILRLKTAHKVELTGANGGPIQAAAGPDLSQLSADDLRTLKEIHERAGGAE